MAKQQQKQQNSKVIEPIIRANGEPNVLETLFDGPEEELPTLKSIGYAKVGGSSWISYVMTTRGKEIIKIEVSEPNLRAIAEEESKINFVNCFVDSML